MSQGESQGLGLDVGRGEKPGDGPSEIWVFPKIRGKPPKLDGENNGKPYF